MRKLAIVLCMVLTAAWLPSCGVPAAKDGKLRVVATIFPCYDFARAVAGERLGGEVELTMLIRPGGEIHSFDPAPSDLLAVQNADVFIYIGGESDVWVDHILESLGGGKKQLLRLMEHVPALEEETGPGMQTEADGEEEEDAYDEHIWTSPRNAIALVNGVRDAFCAADPAGAAVYTANAAAYTAQIEEVRTAIGDVVASAARREIVVADRFPFRYLTEEFGLTYMAAFPGCSSEADVGAATLANMVRHVREAHIPCVYYVELSNRLVADAVKAETGCETVELNACQAIGRNEFEAGETYVSIMRRNVDALRKGLL